MNITDLNQVLTEHLLHKLLIPLYICSLTSIRRQSDTSIETATQNLAKVLNRSITIGENLPINQLESTNNGKVSCIVALFLLSQVFLIISHAPLIQTLAWIILKTDKNLFDKGAEKLLEYYEKEICNNRSETVDSGVQRTDSFSSKESCSSKENLLEEQLRNKTDEEKELLVTAPNETSSAIDKPFLETIYNALDCSENDYSALFALSLLYALTNNKGCILKYFIVVTVF